MIQHNNMHYFEIRIVHAKLFTTKHILTIVYDRKFSRITRNFRNTFCDLRKRGTTPENGADFEISKRNFPRLSALFPAKCAFRIRELRNATCTLSQQSLHEN